MAKSRLIILLFAAAVVYGCGAADFSPSPTAPGAAIGSATLENSDPVFSGCTPGKWKNNLEIWTTTGLSPGQSVSSVFAAAAAYPQGGNTLLEALDFGGGRGVEGGVRNLLRAGVAALLNALSSGVSYPLTAAEVISQVDAALASGDRQTMLDLAEELDALNNLGSCFEVPPPPPGPVCLALLTDPVAGVEVVPGGGIGFVAQTTAPAGVSYSLVGRVGSSPIPGYPDPAVAQTDASGNVAFPAYSVTSSTAADGEIITFSVVGEPACTASFTFRDSE